MPACCQVPFLKALVLTAGLCFCMHLSACGRQEAPLDAAHTPKALRPELTDLAAYSGSNAYEHTRAICSIGPRPSGSAGYMAQVEYLEEHLQAAGWQTRREGFTPMTGMRMVNLHACFGEADSTRPLLITCHIDTKAGIPGFIGADDGASGAAVMLESARILAAQHPEWASKIEFIFFDGEEAFGKHMTERDGMYGSKHDVARRLAQGGKDALPRWQVNLDMVGGRDLLIAIPLLDTCEAMQQHYQNAVDALGLPTERWTAYPGSYLDDHLPYVQAGVDSLNLIAWFQGGGWWHTTRDNMGRISGNSLAESGRMLLQLCRQLLGANSSESSH